MGGTALEGLLSGEKENVIVVLASDETNIDGILAYVSSVQNSLTSRSIKNPAIQVIGSSRWARLQNIEKPVLQAEPALCHLLSCRPGQRTGTQFRPPLRIGFQFASEPVRIPGVRHRETFHRRHQNARGRLRVVPEPCRTAAAANALSLRSEKPRTQIRERRGRSFATITITRSKSNSLSAN